MNIKPLKCIHLRQAVTFLTVDFLLNILMMTSMLLLNILFYVLYVPTHQSLSKTIYNIYINSTCFENWKSSNRKYLMNQLADA